MLLVDVPCARCGSNLRHFLTTGQCSECGLDVGRSLSLASVRSGDPAQLDRLATGLDAQVWGSILAMAACVAAPLLLDQSLSLQLAAVAMAVVLSSLGAWFMLDAEPADTNHPLPGLHRLFWRVGIPTGTGALVLLGLGVHAKLFPMQSSLLTVCIAGCICWFAAESSKLHFIEQLTRLVPNHELLRQARHIRWGQYGMVLMLGVGLIQAILEASSLGMPTPVLREMFVTMVAVSLLVFTILTVLLYSRMSHALQQQVRYARALRQGQTVLATRQEMWLRPNFRRAILPMMRD